jgi:hypothetical protein
MSSNYFNHLRQLYGSDWYKLKDEDEIHHERVQIFKSIFSSNCVLDRWAYRGFRQFCKSSSCSTPLGQLPFDNVFREGGIFIIFWITTLNFSSTDGQVTTCREFSTITQWRELSRIFLEKRSPTTFLLTWCTPGYHWSLPTSPFFGRLCTNTGELCIVMHLHKCIQTPRLLLLGVFTMWKGMWVRPCITLHLGWVYMRVMV